MKIDRRAVALIEADLDALPSGVLREEDFEDLLANRRTDWGLGRFESTATVLSALMGPNRLQHEEVTFARLSLHFLVWRHASPYELPWALSGHAYLSHYTALMVHDLTDNRPKTVYLANPRPPRRRERPLLDQDVVDRAMRATPRLTSNRGEWHGHEIVLVESEVPAGLTVAETIAFAGREIRVATLERTLFDAVVRPEYCGGIAYLPEIFRRAVGRLSINRLLRLLRGLNTGFPYHNVMGFLLERAGYEPKLLRQLHRLEDHGRRFFVARGEPDTMAFDSAWQVFYPREFDEGLAE